MSIWQRLNTFRFVLVLLLLAGVGLAFWISKSQTAAEGESSELISAQNAIKYDTLLMIDAVRDLAATPRSAELRDQEYENLAGRRFRQAAHDMDLQVSVLRSRYPQRGFPQLATALTDVVEFTSTNGSTFLGQALELAQKNPENAASFFDRRHAEFSIKRDQLFRDLEAEVERINRSKALQAQTITIAGTICLVIILAASLVVGHLQSTILAAPLNRLAAILEHMRQGDFTRRLSLDHRDEFGVVGQGLDHLADDLCQLVGRVQRSGLRVTTAAGEISETAKRQQDATRQIADMADETGATSREISATSKELVKTIKEVSQVAEQTGQLTSQGQSALAQMEATMRQMMEAAGAIAARLAVLSEKTGSINSVITTITKVADQTNLLSLNAAIEAEKAGEYGLGFAVVATEIRRLADQTAVATFDIEKTVKEMESAVVAGVTGMDRFAEQVRSGVEEVRRVGAQLAQIISQIQTLPPRFQAANEGVRAQSEGAQQISDTLADLMETAQQTAEALRHSNLAIEELNEAARNLQSTVSRFKLRAEAEALENFTTGSKSGLKVEADLAVPRM